MKTAVVLNALLESPQLSKGRRFLWKEKIAGFDPVHNLLDKFRKLVNKEDIYLLIERSLAEELKHGLTGCHLIVVDEVTASEVFKKIYKACRDYEDIIYCYVDAPLVDTDIVKQMLKAHHEEIADYTYGEGFPDGIVPEVFKVNLLPKLISLIKDEKKPINRDSVFQAISRDINSFDIETIFSKRDMRLERIQLFTSLKRTRLIVEGIVSRKGFDCGIDELIRLIESEPDITRTVPSYVEMEITNRSNTQCVYSPLGLLTRPIGSMNYEDFRTAFYKLLEFCESFHLSLSFLGEPLLHPQIKRFIELAAAEAGVTLILETDGTLFTPDFSDYINNLGAENLYIIFEVDAVKDETYRRIRGGELGKVERNIRYLLEKGMDNVYVQMVRMDINEEEMLQFFEVWEKEAMGAIIQKYNSYLNLLPILSEVDLRPLERNPCWHLLRDLVVFWDGTISRCKQDINARFGLGNILKDELSDIWRKGQPLWLDHCRKEYDEYCKICDEYFTFNF